VTRRRIGVLVAGLVVLVVLAAGCDVGTDDEMAPAPTRTVTATPSQSVAPAPATIPVGTGKISPSDIVWSQGSVLHVGDRQVDLAPVEVDAFVVVPGGIFVLGGGELWFTDLARLRGTAQTEVTDVRVTAAADRLEVVDERSGAPLSQAYDTGTGKAVTGTITPRTLSDRLGEPVGVTVAEKLTLGDPGTGIPGRQGPGRYGLATAPGQLPVPFDAETPTRLPLSGLPARFELEGWSGPDVFYGLDLSGGGPRAVVSCDLSKSRCTRVARVGRSEPVVFANPQ
jgi:hypothetical protein